MFKLQPNPTFAHDVTISTPAGPATLSLEFRHQGKKDLDRWAKGLNTGSDIEIIGHIVCGWNGVVDAAGALVNFSLDALASLLNNYPGAAQEIFVEYIKVLREGRAKN